jgi:anti-sigma factor RsiW
MEMNPMNTPHPLQQIPDYVLGLLSPEERFQVEQHTKRCAECRRVLARERKIEALIRQTVQVTTQPMPARLAAIRPDYPRKRLTPAVRILGQLAPVTLISFLLALSLLFQLTGYSPIQGPHSPAFIATISSPTLTPTTTRLPTATIAALSSPVSFRDERNFHNPEANPVQTIDASSSGNTFPIGSSTSMILMDRQLTLRGTLSPPPSSTPIAHSIP